MTGEKKLRGRIFIFLKQKKNKNQRTRGDRRGFCGHQTRFWFSFFLKIVFLVMSCQYYYSHSYS